MRWLRISLRTLLILVTAFCVWLGIKVNHARRQQAAVQKVEELGGLVYYDYECRDVPGEDLGSVDPSAQLRAPQWLLNRLGQDYFATVVKVVGSGPEMTDDVLGVLTDFPDLKYVELHDAFRISDAGFAHLKSLSDLQAFK